MLRIDLSQREPDWEEEGSDLQRAGLSGENAAPQLFVNGDEFAANNSSHGFRTRTRQRVDACQYGSHDWQ